MTPPQPTEGFSWLQGPAGWVLRSERLGGVVPHFFTSASLRLREDESEWAAVAGSIGVPPAFVRLVHQVHGRDVSVVRRGEPPAGTRDEADILISDDPATAVAVRVADCAPILLADRGGHAVGAAHAGWRGTLQNVAGTAVRALEETFGVEPANLVAAVGPCLGPCCGEMGPEVVEEFRAAGHGGADLDRWFRSGPRGRPHFDLWLANLDQLQRAGVPAGSIDLARLCTRCRPDVFHSYRAGGRDVGRMAGVIRAN